MPPVTPEALVKNPEIMLQLKGYAGQCKSLDNVSHTCV